MSLKKPLSNKKIQKLEADLKDKAEGSKTWFSWVGYQWGRFETWVHSWFPGVKTKITAGLGAIGSGAGLLYTYVSGLPATKYISSESLLIVSAVMFTLSYWFHGMGDRVDARIKEMND